MEKLAITDTLNNFKWGLVFGIIILFQYIFPLENEWGSTWHVSAVGGRVSVHRGECVWEAPSPSTPTWGVWGILGPKTEELSYV